MKTFITAFLLLFSTIHFAQPYALKQDIKGSNFLSKGDALNITDFGAKGDSATDISGAWYRAQQALPNRGGTIYFPAGVYKINSTLTVNKPVTLLGDGAGAIIYGQQPYSTTKLITTVPNLKIFEVHSNSVTFNRVHIENVSWNGTNQSGGAGIYVTECAGFKVRDCYIAMNWNNIDFESCYSFSITGSSIVGAGNIGIRLRNILIPDEGDGTITDNYIYPKYRDNYAAVYQESGGGLKMGYNKCNNSKLADGGPWWSKYFYKAKFTGATSDVFINNNSIENYGGYFGTPGKYGGHGIDLDCNGEFFGHVTIVGNQFAGLGPDIADIALYDTLGRNIRGCSPGGFTITGNTFRALSDRDTLLINMTCPNEIPGDVNVSFCGNTVKGGYVGKPIPTCVENIGGGASVQAPLNGYSKLILRDDGGSAVGTVEAGSGLVPDLQYRYNVIHSTTTQNSKIYYRIAGDVVGNFDKEGLNVKVLKSTTGANELNGIYIQTQDIEPSISFKRAGDYVAGIRYRDGKMLLNSNQNIDFLMGNAGASLSSAGGFSLRKTTGSQGTNTAIEMDLDIHRPRIQFYDSSKVRGAIQWKPDSLKMSISSEGDIDILTGLRSRIFVKGEDGNIGIGTQKPTNTLDVNGGITARFTQKFENVTTVPTAAPSSGCLLYSDGDFLKYWCAGMANAIAFPH